MSWIWRDEPEPPPPLAAICLGPSSRGLWQQLRCLAPSRRGGLTVTAHHDLLLVAGDSEALPWMEGISYAAPRAQAPSLWLPTTSRPQVPLDLLARTIHREHGQQPFLLWPNPAQLVPLKRLLPASDAVLDRIRSLWSD